MVHQVTSRFVVNILCNRTG